MRKIIFLTVFALTGILAFADPKGEEIAKKYFDLKEPVDSYGLATMTLIDKGGSKKTRKLEMYSKKTSEGMSAFMKFSEPADVAGTKFLVTPHKGNDDEQRLYLPALKKTRKISSSNKEGKFVGSDIFYYDLEDRDFEDHDYKYLKDEKYNEFDCSVIEMTSKDPNTPYSKAIIWINKADNFVYKTQCFDKKTNGLLKTIVIVKVKNIDGILVPEQMVVDNHMEGTKTLLQLNNIKINSGLKDDIFSIKNLEG